MRTRASALLVTSPQMVSAAAADVSEPVVANAMPCGAHANNESFE